GGGRAHRLEGRLLLHRRRRSRRGVHRGLGRLRSLAAAARGAAGGMTMELICYEVFPGRVELRPAPRRREWMDETREKMAYHCLPLVIANLHGWEMVCPFGFTARWNGGARMADLTIAIDEADAAEAA